MVPDLIVQAAGAFPRAAGLLAVTPCYRGGHTTVRGVLSRDTTKQATAEVVIVVQAFALVFIHDIRRAADQQPVDLEQVAGTVEVDVRAPALTCHDLVDLQLQITGPAGDTLLPAIHFDPPPSPTMSGVFTWETAASVGGVRVFPDGEYQVHGIRHEIPELRVVSSPISLRVRNQ